MENNNKKLIIVAIVLVFCLIGLCGYIVYDTKYNKSTDNNELKNDKQENNTKKEDNNEETVLPLEKNIVCSNDIDILKGYKYIITYESNFLRYKIINANNKVLYETHIFDPISEKDVKNFSDKCKEYKFLELKGEDNDYKYFLIKNEEDAVVYSIKDDEIKEVTEVSEYYMTGFKDGYTDQEVDSVRVENGVLYIITNYDEEPAEFKYFFNNGSYGRVKTSKSSYVAVSGVK